MNTIDIILIVLILLSSIIGFWRGITREVLGILSWGLSVIITYFLHALPEPIIGTFVTNEFLKEILSTLAVFLLALIILTSLTYSLSDAVKASVARGADKVLGFLFGSFRGFFFIAILALGVNKFLLKNSETAPALLKESKLIPISHIMITRLIQSVPPGMMNKWKDRMESFLSDISLKGPQKAVEIIEKLPEALELNDDE